MVEKRCRVSVELPEELYDKIVGRAKVKLLSPGAYLRMLVAERLAQLERRRKNETKP